MKQLLAMSCQLTAILFALPACGQQWIEKDSSVTIKLGPFVDATDGVTPETGLSIGFSDVRISKNGGDFVQQDTGGGPNTHDENGHYDILLVAADTDTLGRLRVAVNESGARPVWQDFMVVPANVYDSLVGGSDTLDTNVTQYGGTNGTFANGRPEVNASHAGGSAIQQSGGFVHADVRKIDDDAAAAANAERFFDGSGYGVHVRRVTVTSVVSQTAFIIDAVLTAKPRGCLLVIRDNADPANNFMIAECTDYVNAEEIQIEPVGGAGGTFTVGAGDTIDILPHSFNGSDRASLDAILVDTGTTLDDLVDDLESRLTTARAGYLDNLNGHTPQTGDAFVRLGAPAGTSVSADIAAIEAQTDDIGAAGTGLSAIPWNDAWDTEVESEANDALIANHLDHLFAADYDPAAEPGVATALLNELVENDGGVSRFTANALETAPSGASAPAIADAVWDEARSGHVSAGSFGEYTNAQITGTINTFDELIDGAPTFGAALDAHGYTTARALKIDVLAPSLLISTTISNTPAPTQTTFALVAGPPDDDALNGALVVITDANDSSQKAVGLVKDYVGGTSRTVKLIVDPGIFTMAAGDKVDVIAGGVPIPLWLGGGDP